MQGSTERRVLDEWGGNSSVADVIEPMDCINAVRPGLWRTRAARDLAGVAYEDAVAEVSAQRMTRWIRRLSFGG